MLNREITEEIKKLKNNPQLLGSFMMQLSKYNKDAILYKDVYTDFLKSDDWYLKKVSLFALLFTFKINDEYIISRAIDIFCNTNEDFETRMWAAEGIATVCKNSKNHELSREVIKTIEKDIDFEIKIIGLELLLRLWGIELHEIYILKDKLKKFSIKDKYDEYNIYFYDKINFIYRQVDLKKTN